MYTDTLSLNSHLMEITKHGTDEFPIQFYIDELHKFQNGCLPLHWHKEAEILVVTAGTVLIQIGSQKVSLHTGEGIFINGNILHMFEQINNEYCQCPNIVFLPELISPLGSVSYSKYILPIISETKLPFLILHPEVNWQNDILESLHVIFILLKNYGTSSICGEFPQLTNEYDMQADCYELKVQEVLSHIWQLLYSNYKAVLQTSQSKNEQLSQIRLQQMLLFIQKNYKNKISLSGISAFANISNSEAARCFHNCLLNSPIEYLINYRMEKAKQLLLSSQMTVFEIALETGFTSPSYFSKLFKELAGMTPLEYRRSTNKI